jgi:thiosulfate reductase cytochrome b subunit
MKVVPKHSFLLRVFHWINVPLLALMVWSGWLIYWANDVYPGFFPQWFYDFMHIPYRLAEGISIHFFVAWLFVFNGLAYFLWFFFSRHAREVLPRTETFRLAWPTFLHDLGLRKQAPEQDKFNALQKIAYSALLVVAALEVLSGFAIYKPVQLGWLVVCFGGYEGARLVHFSMMILFCLFVVLHVIQVARAGWNNFRAMVAGFEVEK